MRFDEVVNRVVNRYVAFAIPAYAPLSFAFGLAGEFDGYLLFATLSGS